MDLATHPVEKIFARLKQMVLDLQLDGGVIDRGAHRTFLGGDNSRARRAAGKEDRSGAGTQHRHY